MALCADFDEVREEPNYHELDDTLGADELTELIRQLPVGYRTVFNLYAIEGYRHEEIAEMLGISSGTSKSQLNRARKLLQKKLVRLNEETEKAVSYGR